MTHDPVVLRHDDTIAVALNKMAVGGFRHIPIVEDGRPVGVVTARDVFRHLAQIDRVTSSRPSAVVVLADDLIWATRLVEAIERRRGRAAPLPSTARPRLAARRWPAPTWRSSTSTARALRRGRGDRARRAGAGLGSSRSASTTTSPLRKRALAARCERVYAYRKLFDDGPERSRWLSCDTARPSERRSTEAIGPR